MTSASPATAAGVCRASSWRTTSRSKDRRVSVSTPISRVSAMDVLPASGVSEGRGHQFLGESLDGLSRSHPPISKSAGFEPDLSPVRRPTATQNPTPDRGEARLAAAPRWGNQAAGLCKREVFFFVGHGYLVLVSDCRHF